MSKIIQSRCRHLKVLFKVCPNFPSLNKSIFSRKENYNSEQGDQGEGKKKNVFGLKFWSRKDKICCNTPPPTSPKKNFKFEETHSKQIVTKKRGKKFSATFWFCFFSGKKFSNEVR